MKEPEPPEINISMRLKGSSISPDAARWLVKEARLNHRSLVGQVRHMIEKAFEAASNA